MTTRLDALRQTLSKHALVVCACLAGTSALAQSTTADGPASTLTLSTGATLGDDAGAFAAAALSINRATRTQTLSFDLSAQMALDAGDDFAISSSDPVMTLSYTNIGGPVTFQGSYTFVRGDVDGISSAQDDITQEQTLITDQGTRSVSSASTILQYGARGPFGATLSLDYNLYDYDGTTDIRLYDRETQNAELALRFDISPVLQLTTVASILQEEDGDFGQTNTLRRFASAGLSLRFNPVTTLDGALTYTSYSTERDLFFFGRTRTQTDAVGFQLAMKIDQRNGDTQFSYDRSLDQGRAIDRLTYSRSRDLSGVQRLAYSIGAVRRDDDDIALAGSVSYRQNLRNGALTLTAGQDAIYSALGYSAITRQIQTQYATDLTPLSALTASASFSSINYDDDLLTDVQTAKIGLGYAHQLNRDWDVSGNISYNWSQDGNNRSDSSELSVALNRQFSLFR